MSRISSLIKEPLESSLGEGNGTPLQYSCLENPMDGGAWWAAVHGVAQSRTQLKRLSSSSREFPHTSPSQVAIYQEGPHQTPALLASHFRLLASRTGRYKLLSFINHLVHGTLLQQLTQTQTFTQRGHGLRLNEKGAGAGSLHHAQRLNKQPRCGNSQKLLWFEITREACPFYVISGDFFFVPLRNETLLTRSCLLYRGLPRWPQW